MFKHFIGCDLIKSTLPPLAKYFLEGNQSKSLVIILLFLRHKRISFLPHGAAIQAKKTKKSFHHNSGQQQQSRQACSWFHNLSTTITTSTITAFLA